MEATGTLIERVRIPIEDIPAGFRDSSLSTNPTRSWVNLMKEEEWETCAKRDEFKRMIVGLLFFHANIQVSNDPGWCKPAPNQVHGLRGSSWLACLGRSISVLSVSYRPKSGMFYLATFFSVLPRTTTLRKTIPSVPRQSVPLSDFFFDGRTCLFWREWRYARAPIPKG